MGCLVGIWWLVDTSGACMKPGAQPRTSERGACLAVAACCLRTRLMSATKPCTSSARRKSSSRFSASSAAHLTKCGTAM